MHSHVKESNPPQIILRRSVTVTSSIERLLASSWLILIVLNIKNKWSSNYTVYISRENTKETRRKKTGNPNELQDPSHGGGAAEPSEVLTWGAINISPETCLRRNSCRKYTRTVNMSLNSSRQSLKKLMNQKSRQKISQMHRKIRNKIKIPPKPGMTRISSPGTQTFLGNIFFRLYQKKNIFPFTRGKKASCWGWQEISPPGCHVRGTTLRRDATIFNNTLPAWETSELHLLMRSVPSFFL